MSTKYLRLVVLAATLLLAAVASLASSPLPRCVTQNGISYCCWPGNMCRVCDSIQCYLLPVSECPQTCGG
jgi:hypothetical protein